MVIKNPDFLDRSVVILGAKFTVEFQHQLVDSEINQQLNSLMLHVLRHSHQKKFLPHYTAGKI